MSRLTEIADRVRVVDEEGPTPDTRTLKASISFGYKIDVSEHTMRNPQEAKHAREFVVQQLLYSIMGAPARSFDEVLYALEREVYMPASGWQDALTQLRDWVKVNCNNKPVDVRH